jgi:hypothetical protein
MEHVEHLEHWIYITSMIDAFSGLNLTSLNVFSRLHSLSFPHPARAAAKLARFLFRPLSSCPLTWIARASAGSAVDPSCDCLFGVENESADLDEGGTTPLNALFF